MTALALSLVSTLPTLSADTPVQISDNINIAGHWSFNARIQTECTFGGTAVLTSSGVDTYSVDLTARQSCVSLEEDYLVRQECVGRQFGNQLSVRCKIAEFLNGFESPYYYSDNFTLTIASGARMHGALISAGNASPAEWTRSEGGIS